MEKNPDPLGIVLLCRHLQGRCIPLCEWCDGEPMTIEQFKEKYGERPMFNETYRMITDYYESPLEKVQDAWAVGQFMADLSNVLKNVQTVKQEQAETIHILKGGLKELKP